MRAIDADALIGELHNTYLYDDNARKVIYRKIEEQPTIEPEQRWIPCSERLPEKYIGQWLCCTSDGDVMILPYDTPGDGTKECVFYTWDDDGYFYQIFDVIAWMPLPQPYKGGEQDDA